MDLPQKKLISWTEISLTRDNVCEGLGDTRAKDIPLSRGDGRKWVNNLQYKYTINNGDTVRPLSITTSEKDLGVYIDPLLNFNDHITTTVKKARSLTGMILRSIKGRTKDILIPLFIGLVRPVLEYANPVWSPQKKYRKNRKSSKTFHQKDKWYQ